MAKLKYKMVFMILIVLSSVIVFKETYAMSDNFKFVIDTIGIPRNNVFGQEINEDIYYIYNLFVYGTPLKLVGKDNLQRWKNSMYGYWTKGGGKYNGIGVRGEYYFLGYSYSGSTIHNYYFPMDSIPTTTPETWTFYSNPGAEGSWQDVTKYKYIEQLEHAKNSKLMFNDLSSKDRANNPNYIKEYNITPKTIGLKLAKLDTAPTWKTNGVIHTRRKISGIIYSQVFLIPPMAAKAKIKNNLSIALNYVLKADEDQLVIPIKYGSAAINITGYADKKHIKTMKSNLYIDDKLVDNISGSKIMSVGNEYMLVITREKFPPNRNYQITIRLESYMHTEFAVDGLMQDKTNETINLQIEPKTIIPVKEKDMKILSKEFGEWVVSPLAQTYITSDRSSIGFTEAGKHLAIKAKVSVPKKEISNIKVVLDEKTEIDYEIVNSKEENLLIKFQVPKLLEASLYGMDSLRQKNANYFSVNQNEIGTRKRDPHTVTINFDYQDKGYSERFSFDTLDNYIANINSKIKQEILNYKDLEDKEELKNWMEN